jgi:drug/metabolite transporter (DMT)-like permease
VVGIASAALPFMLFGFAALHISAGLSAIFNAVTPLAAAAIAALFLGEKLGARRIAGCVVGFAGVLWLVWHASSFGVVAGGAASELAVLACLAAALLYAVSATYTKQRLANVSPLAIAAGGQLVSALLLALPAVCLWPATLPSARAGAALVALALACTALAYLMFFRLIANVGAARAVTVAFLIPAFGVLWGTLFLGETFTLDMATGCALILIGTALAIGLTPAFRRGRPGFRSSAPACAAHTPPARSHGST